MSEITRHDDYRQALADIKLRIQSAQVRAVFAVNSEMLALYWDIGRRLLLWQSEQGWGAAVVEQMASDLHATYPQMKGFSRSSLFAMRQMVEHRRVDIEAGCFGLFNHPDQRDFG